MPSSEIIGQPSKVSEGDVEKVFPALSIVTTAVVLPRDESTVELETLPEIASSPIKFARESRCLSLNNSSKGFFISNGYARKSSRSLKAKVIASARLCQVNLLLERIPKIARAVGP